MDHLHYKILKPGTQCWALFASIDEPFVYLPIQCEIYDVKQYNSLRYSYLLRPIAFADEFKIVNKYFNNKMYRMYNYDKHRTSDRKIQINTTFNPKVSDIVKEFNTVFADEYLVALAPVVFETFEQCISELKKFELALSEDFMRALKFFAVRYKNYKNR